jgi:hypothetical protein
MDNLTGERFPQPIKVGGRLDMGQPFEKKDAGDVDVAVLRSTSK